MPLPVGIHTPTIDRFPRIFLPFPGGEIQVGPVAPGLEGFYAGTSLLVHQKPTHLKLDISNELRLDSLASLPRGISRHVVRFAHLAGAVVAYLALRSRGVPLPTLRSRMLWLRSGLGTAAMALTFYVLASPAIALGDGKRLATAHGDKNILTWKLPDAAGGKAEPGAVFAAPAAINLLATLSPTQLLASGPDGIVRVLDAEKGSAVRTTPQATPSVTPGASASPPGYRLGQRVTHARFGDGVILQCEGEGNQARIEVRFQAAGTKWLMLAYANLQSLP